MQYQSKKRFCDALIRYRIIRDSNLADIFNTEKDVFNKALSFHDYEVLLHAVLTLMSRKGFRARVVCPECKMWSFAPPRSPER